MELLTQSQYAGWRQVSPAAVHRYIKDGKIPKNCLKTKNGKRLIDRDKADAALFENLDRIMNPRFNPQAQEIPTDVIEKITQAGVESLTLEEAQRLQAHYRGELLRLEYRQKTGELVPVADVEEIGFTTGRRFRDAILNIPERVAAMIASDRDRRSIARKLKKEILEAAEELNFDESLAAVLRNNSRAAVL
jgi:hypothetical protein